MYNPDNCYKFVLNTNKRQAFRMKVPLASIIDHLSSHGIKPSAQRIAIMRYLMENPVHPTADEIHQGLLPEIPTLSRTTIYNTLWLMADQQAVNVIGIDRNNARFEYSDHPHAHFRCSRCGRIFDIKTDMHALTDGLDGLRIDSTHVYHTGLCADCQN